MRHSASNFTLLREAAGLWAGVRVAGIAGVAAGMSGCAGHRQSVLHHASKEASQIAGLWWFMFAVLAAAFVLVIALTVWAVFARPKDPSRPPGGGNGFIIAGGIVLPSVVVVTFLFASLNVSLSLRQPREGMVIQVTGHQWWWDVRYPGQGIVTANEIYIPAGEPVRLELKSADVVHSFWVPNLHGKMDALPDVVTRFWLHAEEPGSWRGQCAEFCGRQHAWMAFEVVALPREEFDDWVAARQRPQPVAEDPRQARGKEVFFRASCNDCHSIRGTRAEGETGPDLTHIGSRLTLGAATVPNNRGNLAGWIANSQEIKPGNRMPRSYLDSEDLEALVDYLESLE